MTGKTTDKNAKSVAGDGKKPAKRLGGTTKTIVPVPESDETVKPKLDTTRLRRRRVEPEDEPQSPPSVSAGAVDKAIDLAFNPSKEKLREVTIIDRVQGRLFPMLDVINLGRQYCLEIAIYRQDADEYKRLFKRLRPVAPNLLEELLYRTAQWQKSVQGTNLTKITDIALAETETRTDNEGGQYGSSDAWGRD